MTNSYEIIDHQYDVIVIGAGGSGLRATLGVAEVDPEHAGNKMRELGKSFSLPVAVGPAEIGAFYRRLYNSNK